MCSKCENVQLGITIPHQISACPLLRASYCSVCCSYGHFTSDCPDEEACEGRKVQFVEQLIPFTVRQRYNITTTTPITDSIQEKKLKQPELLVEKTPKAMRQILMNYEIQPSGKDKELSKQVLRLAEQLKRKVEFVSPKVDEATKQNNKKKKTSSSKKSEAVA